MCLLAIYHEHFLRFFLFGQDQSGAGSTPPTFRMYTTGDIFEALGAEVAMRSRDVSWTCRDAASGQNGPNGAARRRREEVSIVEVQATWVGGCTYILAWLDSVEVTANATCVAL